MSQFPEEPLNLTASEGFGYFPAYPGLKLKENRYEVIRKLGYGPRSSVWLVTDLQGDNGYLALKILTAHTTLQKTRELKRLQAVKQSRSFTNLPNLHDHFIEISHHGRHSCFGLSVLGASVQELRSSSPTKTLPVHVVQKVIASVLEGLGYLHRTRILHGAVILDNIHLFVGQRETDLDPVLAKLPPCTIEQKVTVDDIEYPIVRSQPIPHHSKWNDTHFDVGSFFLNNLGHAQTIESMSWEKSGMDKSLRPPEVILGTGYNPKVDIWMLGCCTYELLTEKPLVPAEKLEDDGKLIGWLMAMTGDQIERETVLEAKQGKEFFDENGVFTGAVPDETLESQLAASGNISANDIPEIVKFIKACLLLNLSERPTTGLLIEHEWLEPSFACSCGYH